MGTDRSRSARSSAGSAPSSGARQSRPWRESSRSSPICCSARTSLGALRPPATRRCWSRTRRGSARAAGRRALVVDLTADAGERIEQIDSRVPHGVVRRSRSTRTSRRTCAPRPSRPGSTWSSRARGWRARARVLVAARSRAARDRLPGAPPARASGRARCPGATPGGVIVSITFGTVLGSTEQIGSGVAGGAHAEREALGVGGEVARLIGAEAVLAGSATVNTQPEPTVPNVRAAARSASRSCSGRRRRTGRCPARLPEASTQIGDAKPWASSRSLQASAGAML